VTSRTPKGRTHLTEPGVVKIKTAPAAATVSTLSVRRHPGGDNEHVAVACERRAVLTTSDEGNAANDMTSAMVYSWITSTTAHQRLSIRVQIASLRAGLRGRRPGKKNFSSSGDSLKSSKSPQTSDGKPASASGANGPGGGDISYVLKSIILVADSRFIVTTLLMFWLAIRDTSAAQ
jgi:hypothetical protein